MRKAGEILDYLLRGGTLDAQTMEDLIGRMMDGELPDAVIAGFLVAMRARGEDALEIAAAARAMRRRVIRVPISSPENTIDTCGTGGDGADTINISTAAACVVAAAGVPVAKHGNRSVSSRCGSADVLETLGVRLELGAEDLARLHDDIGITFLFAPRLHPAMKSVMPVRRAMGIRTLFNLLGPLTNPAGVGRQLIGVWSTQGQDLLAGALADLGASHAIVVHSEDGLDEFSVFAPTRVLEIRDGQISGEWFSRPEELGLRPDNRASLSGGDVEYNARRMREILGGKELSAASESVALNSAGAFLIAGREEDLGRGLDLARETLSSGSALEILEILAAESGKLPKYV